MMLEPALAVLVVLAGLILGSMVTTAALRTTRAEQAVTGRSHCDGCGRSLGYMATLPVVSFVWLKGACQSCKAPIDRLHPAGELAGLAVIGSAFWLVPPARAVLISLLGLALLGAAVHEQKARRIPDLLILAAAAAGAALSWLSAPQRLGANLLAAALILCVLQGLRLALHRVRGVEVLDPGEVKLIGALALWLGTSTPWMVALAAVLALAAFALIRPADGRLRFGPMIAAAGFALGLWQEMLIR